MDECVFSVFVWVCEGRGFTMSRSLAHGVHEKSVELHSEVRKTGNLVKDENGDLLAGSHNILNRWKNYYSQLLNVYRASDVRGIEIHTEEPLVPDPSLFESEIAIAELKRYKSPGSDQIPAELIQVRSEILRSKIHKLINSIWNAEKLSDQCKEAIIIPVHKKSDKTDCSSYRGYHCHQLHTKFCEIFCT
jgi:hypothetical protein